MTGRVWGTAIGMVPKPDGLPNAETLGQQPHRGDEPLPLEVRLHAGQQQERRADTVVQGVQTELGIVVVGEVIGLERHQRPPRAVVEQLVDRERRHQLGVQAVFQVAGGEPDRVTGVGKAFQGVYQDRAAAIRRRQLGRRELELVHAVLLRNVRLVVVHRCCLLATAQSVAPSQIVSLKSGAADTGPRSRCAPNQ